MPKYCAKCGKIIIKVLTVKDGLNYHLKCLQRPMVIVSPKFEPAPNTPIEKDFKTLNQLLSMVNHYPCKLVKFKK